MTQSKILLLILTISVIVFHSPLKPAYAQISELKITASDGAALDNCGESASIPDVYFVIVRVDLLTFEVKGFYEFSQPFRKSLLGKDYLEKGDILYNQAPATDFGFTKAVSKITGQLVMHASTVWAGSGGFQFPVDSLYSDSFEVGIDNPNPGSFNFISLFGGTEEDAESAWSKAKETDIIKRLSSLGAYNVVVFDHFYSIGVGDPATAEWIIVASTRPPAPDDVGFIGNSWPRNFITKDVSNLPQISVHNFGDSSVDFGIRVATILDGSVGGASGRSIKSLPQDSTIVVKFDPLEITLGNELIIDYQLILLNGCNWVDAFPDNDNWKDTLGVSSAPVFRAISTFDDESNIPLGGVAFDFDDDGDIDVFQYGLNPKFWRRDSEGNYEDITGLSNVTLRMHPRLAIANDFSGDGLTDILVLYFGTSPTFLLGEGSGIFVENTSSANLSNVITRGKAKAVDVEMDGDIDLIFNSDSKILVLLNNGEGIFSFPDDNLGINSTAQTEDITIGDLNNDGYPDIVLSNWNENPAVYVNDGNGFYSLVNGPWNFQYGRTARIFDYNNDGLDDIFFINRLFEETNRLYKNTGNLQFVEDSSQSLLLPGQFHAGIGDVNEDGWIDLILDNLGEITFLLNMGGTFVDFTDHLSESVYFGGALGSSALPEFIDIDGDGDLDIYSKALVLQNQTIPNFVKVKDTDNSPLPEQYILLQNYPNPFNPTTTIKYSIPKSGEVSLIVYNLIGQEVIRLVNENQQQGNHQVKWNASNVASGMYIYRLQAGDYVETRKMVLLK